MHAKKSRKVTETYFQCFMFSMWWGVSLSFIIGILSICTSAHLTVLSLSNPTFSVTFSLLPVTSSHPHASVSDSAFDYWYYINIWLTLNDITFICGRQVSTAISDWSSSAGCTCDCSVQQESLHQTLRASQRQEELCSTSVCRASSVYHAEPWRLVLPRRTQLLPVALWVIKLGGGGGHEVAVFQQTDADFRHRRLWVPNISILLVNSQTWGCSAPKFGIFGRKFSVKKKIFRQAKIYWPPVSMPRCCWLLLLLLSGFPRLLESPGFFLLQKIPGPGKSWKNILETHAFF